MRGREPGYPAELLRGNTDTLLLSVIEEKGHTYGYRLIKEIGKKSEGFFHFKEGTVYPALRKLENEGLIQGEWQELPNGQRRRYYRITEKGEEALRKKIAAWQGFTAAVNLIFKPTKA